MDNVNSIREKKAEGLALFRGWQLALLGGAALLLGVLSFPGAPGCKYCGQVYTGTFVQNALAPLALVALGVAVLVLAAYKMGEEGARR